MLQICNASDSKIPEDPHEPLILASEKSSQLSIAIPAIPESVPSSRTISKESLVSSSKSFASHSGKEIFNAPPGVIPYNIKWSNVRRNSGGPRLIFIWPKKTRTASNFLSYLAPLIRRILIGFIYLDTVHLWPGEFLPTFIPSAVPLPKIPFKCSVIEPLWEEEDKKGSHR